MKKKPNSRDARRVIEKAKRKREEECARLVSNALKKTRCMMIPSFTVEMNQINTGLRYVAIDED